MERYSMFLSRKNQYCENDYFTQCNLHVQCDPYQITNGIFHRTRTKHFTIHMETQKTPNNQSSLLRKKNGAGGINLPDFRLYNKAVVIRTKAEIQTNGTRQKVQRKNHAAMSTLFFTKEARIYNGAKTASSINSTGKTGLLHVKE